MAHRVKVAVANAILVLAQRGWSFRRIAAELGIDRETVTRHVRAAERSANAAISTAGADVPDGRLTVGTDRGAPPSVPPNAAISTAGKAGRQSHCDPHLPVIRAAVEQGLSAQRIFQDLAADHGFAGSYSSVKRFIQRLVATTPFPFRRIECEPGAEAQVDFGRGAPIDEPGRKRHWPHVFRIVLSYSRKAYSEAVWRQTTESFIRALENAFRAFGGVPKTIVIDNLRAAVTKADWYDPDLNPKIEAFARHYGTVILPTKPRMPRHKGKVESAIKYVRTNALKGKAFASLAAENEHLKTWETQVADRRIHGTTRRQVQEQFIRHERPVLLPLPPLPFPLFHEAPRIVHQDAHVAVEKAYYSVPPEYLGRHVWVRWDGRVVRIFNQAFEQIALHVQHEKGRFITDPAHLVPEKISGIERGAEWLLARASLIGRYAAQWGKAMLEARGIRGVRVLQGLLSLAGRHRSAAIEQACQSALTLQAFRLRALRDLLKEDVRQTPLVFAEEHPLIRPLTEYGRLVAQTFPEGRPVGDLDGDRHAAFIAFRADSGPAEEKGPAQDQALPAVRPPVAALGSDASGARSSGPANEAYHEGPTVSIPSNGGSHE
jgi:transposase